MLTVDEYRKELLDLAMRCGARLTGTPDGREPIEVQFSVEAWRKFDVALGETASMSASPIARGSQIHNPQLKGYIDIQHTLDELENIIKGNKT